MLLNSLHTYEEDEIPVSEFKKGQTVYKDSEEVTIAKVTWQPITKVFMYQFEEPNSGFACSALGMRANLEDKPYKLGQIMHVNRSFDQIADEIISSGKDHKLNDARCFI